VNEELKVDGVDALDKAKLWLAVLLIVGGVVAFYYFDDQPTWQRWLAVVAGLVLAVAVIMPSQYGRWLKQFVLDARLELRKVVWPTGRETLQTTALVFGFVVVAGVFFWFVDMLLAWATRHLTGQGG